MIQIILVTLFAIMFAGVYMTVKLDSNFGRILFYGGASVCMAVLFLTGHSA